MVRQQKVRNPLMNIVLMLTISANQLSGDNLCLHKKRVEILNHLFVEVAFGLGRGESREAELKY
jgi:hypothetical protein